MQQTCQTCSRSFELEKTQNRNVIHCPECRKKIVDSYLHSDLPVRVLCFKYHVGDATLRTLAEEFYGIKRSDVIRNRRFQVSGV